MKRLSALLASVTVLTFGFSTLASAHFDVVPYLDLNGKIVTGGYDDGTASSAPVVRAFGYDFGEEPSDPFFISDPGFNNSVTSPSPLTASTSLRFTPLSNLLYWDGSTTDSHGNPVFTLPPSSETIRLINGMKSVTFSGTAVTYAGTLPTALGTTTASGRIHMHLQSSLQGSDGNNIPAADYDSDGDTVIDLGSGDGFEAAPGIYAIQLELYLNGAPASTSDPFWIVYNGFASNPGAYEDTHDTAMNFFDNGPAVPEPASLSILGLAAAALVLRCRK